MNKGGINSQHDSSQSCVLFLSTERSWDWFEIRVTHTWDSTVLSSTGQTSVFINGNFNLYRKAVKETHYKETMKIYPEKGRKTLKWWDFWYLSCLKAGPRAPKQREQSMWDASSGKSTGSQPRNSVWVWALPPPKFWGRLCTKQKKS